MPASTPTNVVKQPLRKPLFGSICMAFFALLWEELAQPRIRSQSWR